MGEMGNDLRQIRQKETFPQETQFPLLPSGDKSEMRPFRDRESLTTTQRDSGTGTRK